MVRPAHLPENKEFCYTITAVPEVPEDAHQSSDMEKSINILLQLLGIDKQTNLPENDPIKMQAALNSLYLNMYVCPYLKYEESCGDWFDCFLEDAGDFFETLVEWLSYIYDAYAGMYNYFKNGIQNTIADGICPDDAAWCNQIVGTSLAVGLSSVGFPPNAPNADALMDIAKNSIIKNTMQTLTGLDIPYNELYSEVSKGFDQEVSKGMPGEMYGWPTGFRIKIDPSLTYVPAYIKFDVTKLSDNNGPGVYTIENWFTSPLNYTTLSNKGYETISFVPPILQNIGDKTELVYFLTPVGLHICEYDNGQETEYTLRQTCPGFTEGAINKWGYTEDFFKLLEYGNIAFNVGTGSVQVPVGDGFKKFSTKPIGGYK